MADALLDRLLEVQAADLAADQLRYRRESLPQRAALRERRAVLDDLDRQLTVLRGRADELDRSQRRMEDEISSMEAKAADSERRLYSGAVNAPRSSRRCPTRWRHSDAGNGVWRTTSST